MRSAIFVALLSVAACKGKHEKETVIITTPPPAAAVEPPPAAIPPAQGSAVAAADDPPTAPVATAPTGGTMTQPLAPVAAAPRVTAPKDAGIIPDAIDTNGLMPEH